jgi:hypothetical protein
VELDRRNFRKKISIKDWLIDIGEMEDDVPHRPVNYTGSSRSSGKKRSAVNRPHRNL